MTRISLRPAAVALAVALACGSAPVFAQSAAAPVSINIAAQPLAQALNDLAQQAQLDLIVQPALVAGKTAPAVSGSLTPQQALDRLLAGSGLIATVDGKTAVVNLAPASSGALPAVTVMADADVDGYVAKRSASMKTSTPIVETPQSISVITKAQLEDQKPRSITEALSYTPGAFTGLVGSSNRYDYVALRGFKDSSVDSTVLDGLRFLSDQGTYSSMQIDPYFLERIDIIRGPSSVMYGQASPGGLVALSSSKPQFQPYHEITATLGNNDRREIGVDLTGPIDDNGVMAFRLTALARKLDSQFDHVKEERQAIAPSLAINFSKDTHLLLQAYLQHDPDGSYHSGMPEDATINADHNGRKISRHFFDGDPSVDKYKRDQHFVGYQFDHRFNDQWSFRQNFRQVWTDVKLRQVYQTGWLSVNELNREYSGADESTRGYVIDNQLEGHFRSGSVEHTVLVGLDHQKREIDGNWQWGTANPINAFDPVYGNPGVNVLMNWDVDRDLKQTGFYLQDQIAWNKWRFAIGGRQDWVDASNQRGAVTGTRDMSRFSKRVGAVYLFDNGMSPYVNYSDGFNPSLANDANGNILPPTETTQREIGLRYQPKDSNTMLSAAIYELKQENISEFDLGLGYNVALGSVRSRGLELEAHTKLSKTFSVLASYTRADVKFTKSVDDIEGNTPYQAPKHMASVWGVWDFLPGYSLGAGLRYVGTSWGDNENTFKVPSYTLADMMLHIDLAKLNPAMKGFDLRVNANNLFDKTYVASCISRGYVDCYWGDERNVTATLTYKW